MGDVGQVVLFSAASVNAGLDLVSPVKRVIERHWYVLGEEVAGFEREFAAFVGVDHCVSVANGTDALEIAMRTQGVGPGDRVVMVANAGFYGSTAAYLIGAVPVYVDVDRASLTMSPQALAEALKHNPKAVVVTHLYGQLANVEDIHRLTKEAGIPLIEDCAQSHGANRNGRQAGSFGEVACFSFYPTKNLGALGDGGAVVTNDGETAVAARALRQYGWGQKYRVDKAGGRNSRLDEMQAAILREKLPHLTRWNVERRRIASRYNEAFAGLPVTTPSSLGEDYVAHLYVLRTVAREKFRQALQEDGIATDIHYPVADYNQPAHPGAILCGSLAVTDEACGTQVTLPCYPGLTDGEIDRVIAAVAKFFQRKGT